MKLAAALEKDTGSDEECRAPTTVSRCRGGGAAGVLCLLGCSLRATLVCFKGGGWWARLVDTAESRGACVRWWRRRDVLRGLCVCVLRYTVCADCLRWGEGRVFIFEEALSGVVRGWPSFSRSRLGGPWKRALPTQAKSDVPMEGRRLPLLKCSRKSIRCVLCGTRFVIDTDCMKMVGREVL